MTTPLLFCLFSVSAFASDLDFVPFDFVIGGATAFVLPGDFDGDQIPDLVLGQDGFGRIAVVTGNGDGTFAQANPIFSDLDLQGNNPIGSVVKDFDNDGNLDLAYTDYMTNIVTIAFGNGDGTFFNGSSFSTIDNRPISMTADDLNSDGILDLITVNPSSDSISVLLGQGGGQFATAMITSVGDRPEGVATGDLNEDGWIDMVTSNINSSDISILFGNGDGTFQPAESYSIPGSAFSVTVGDYDADGKLDIAVASPGTVQTNFMDPGVYVFLNAGSGVFQPWLQFDAGFRPTSIDEGDFNGDGILDLVAGNQFFGGGVNVLIGQGDGTFASALEFNEGLDISSAPRFTLAAQLDSDSRMDVVTLGLFF